MIRSPWGKREGLLRSVAMLAFYNEHGAESAGHDEAEADAVRKQLLRQIERMSTGFPSEALPPQFADWLALEAFRVSRTPEYLDTLESFFERTRTPGAIPQYAFAWMGPFPHDGEHLRDFRFRRVRFALCWALALCGILATLYLLVRAFPSVEQNGIWLASLFAAGLGLAMAVLGAMGLVVAWLKTRLLGPEARMVRYVGFVREGARK